MKTKPYFIAMALLAVCTLAPVTTFAGLIVAKVDSWSKHATQIGKPGGGWKGGGALFDMALIGGTGLPGIDGSSKFLAMCLEPWQSVGRNTYRWELVDLVAAPSSGSRAPMGQAGADSIFNALAYLDNASFDEFTQAERNAFQAVAWLASNPAASINGLSGEEDAMLQAMLGYDADMDELARFSVAALINVGKNGGGQGQDVILYGYRADPPGTSVTGAVPLPATLPLLLGGLLGIIPLRRRRRYPIEPGAGTWPTPKVFSAPPAQCQQR